MTIPVRLKITFRTILQQQGLFWLLLLLFSCSRKNDTPVEMASRASLQARADKGDLLNDVSKTGNSYVFNFETGPLTIPEQEIIRVAAEPERWKTTLTFSDGSTLVIPSKGTSLDFIVEDVKLNPSGYNPLAAMVYVRLPALGRIKVTVRGKNGEAGTITHLFREQMERQNIPVLGLYANYDNKVDLTFTDKDGRERGTTQINIRTAAIPVTDFPILQVLKTNPQAMEPGVNLVSYPGISEIDVSLPYMLDSQGEIRWLLLLKSSPDLQKLSASIGLKRTKKGTFVAGDQIQQRIVELDMFGNLLHQWDLQKLGYTFHHEVTEATNGNFLITVTKSAARLKNGQPRVNDHIIELDPAGGTVVKEWDLTTQLDSSRYQKPDGITPPEFSQSPNNWAHNNSIGEIGGNLLATARYQGIFSFTHSGTVRWIISPHKFWSAAYLPYLLNPVDKNGQPITDPAVISGDAAASDFDWPWGPHTPVVLPNNNILVFDNGYNRNWIPNSQRSDNYSRAVEYKIDEGKKTVQQVWTYGQALGAEGFAQAVSGVQYLKQTGHILFCPGLGVRTSRGYGGRIVEIDPVTKTVLFEMEITAPSGTAFHRVTRMPLYPDTL